MHTTNSLLAATVLAAASAQSLAYEPPGLFAMDTIVERQALKPAPEAQAVLDFWEEAGPAMWFAKDAAFDRRFRERFLLDHEAAARGELAHWQATPEGALALVILLDQFPRNAFRGTARMYATDASGRKAASLALAAGYDRIFPVALRKFFVLPFAHSEDLADQERSVALARRLGADDLAHAEHHRDIVRRFGRFPHRNAILGRDSTTEEKEYLDHGGYAG
ncbi:MAG TPA: DUF924 family protein [Steroidobacteraceae bacterium]|nr:DUF924 family protein [Steroidobacteraceae bacterium]